MKCFGDKMKTFHCKVVLLDEQELIQELQETTSGQDLLDVVFQHLNLIETSYFGLRYIDPSNQTHWLDPNKRLFKQLKGTSPFTLYFSVKFYAADPTKLVEEITRYQFFLQIKQDILQGRLPVPTDLAAELGSLAVQSELGDYDPRRHSPGYVSEFRFVANQSVPLETKIAELHKKLVSYVPSKAELCYLEKVKWLDMYGVDLHPVLGEDSTEYFLGLTPSGIIVLRNKVKVGNYFWPRITKVYFKGRFFMLRVKDKNNGENTYGFETPSKSACKHLWQCCVEHHAFFRLTQAAGNNPQAMVTIGSKFRTASGRSEKEVASESQPNLRPQTEFARTPSRRYQRRIVEGAQDTPRTEETDNKAETRTIVSLPGTVTPVSHVYRSTSMTLAPRSDSPRSIRSAPYPSGAQRPTHHHSVLSNPARREGRPTDRGESPRSIKLGSAGRTPLGAAVPRRTSSVESQSSADSRSCNRSCCRHRRSRGRSSDGESEASSRCSSSKGHRKHHHHRHHHHRRHRHHSDDSSEHHRHRHRKHRPRSSEKSEPQMVESSDQWARVQSGDTTSRTNTATVRDLTNGYMPSGHDDTEFDGQQTQHPHQNHHSSRRKYRKHRSPSDSKPKSYPDEIRRHIEFNLQNSEGLSDAQLKEIPYTKVETAKAVKIKFGSPKNRRHNSPTRSKSSSDQKVHQNSTDAEKENKEGDDNSSTGVPDKDDSSGKIRNKDGGARGQQADTKITNGSLRQTPRSNQASVREPTPSSESPLHGGPANSPRSSPTRGFSHPPNSLEDGTLQRGLRENLPNSSPPLLGPKPSTWNPSSLRVGVNTGVPLPPNRHTAHTNSDDQNMFKTCNYVTSSYNSTSESFPSPYQPQNLHSEGVSPPPPRDSPSHRAQENIPGYRRDPEAEKAHFPGGEDFSNGFIDSTGGVFMAQSPTSLKNATIDKGSPFTAVLKPQPSPQSSVTSGISVGSSSASTTLAETNEADYQRSVLNREEYSSCDMKHDVYNDIAKPLGYGAPTKVLTLANGFNEINGCYDERVHLPIHINRPRNFFKDHGVNQEMNNIENDGCHRIHQQPKDSRIRNNCSNFKDVQRNYNDISSDWNCHTIEKKPTNGSSVNFRNNYNTSNPKLAKERPNSFSYTPKSKLSQMDQNNGHNIHTMDKCSNIKYESSRMFKPILKSFASEDNLNNQTSVKERSKSIEALDNVATNFSNNKNRVRWNIQEKTKNIINLNDDISYNKSRENNTLNGIKPSNVQNVKNNVVYAGKGEIIEIKNNRIVNIKTKRQEPTAITFKKGRNPEGISDNRADIQRDEISTEL